MFTRLAGWIREVWRKVIGKQSLQAALGVEIAISDSMAKALELWSRLYANKAPWASDTVKPLGLPPAIASEIARMVTIEMQVQIAGSARADYLAEQMAGVVDALREQVEYGAALGGLILKPYVDGDQILVDFVRADHFLPVAFGPRGTITSAVFFDRRQAGAAYYTRVEYHRMIEDGCQIQNLAFVSGAKDTLGSEVPLSVIDEWAGLAPEATITDIDRPLFAYFRYPLANNIDSSSPLGVSCYSRAVDLIEDADRIYETLVWEFESGKRAIYVDEDAFQREADGTLRLPDKRLYRTLSTSGSIIGESSKLYEAWSPEFREAAIQAGLNGVLRKIEFMCGLAYGILSDPQLEAKTATEIRASQQRSYATVTDTQKALKAALNHLLYAMDVWASLYRLVPRGSYQAEYSFDDSVVTDRQLQMAEDRATASMGAMPRHVFLMRNYGLDEVTARRWIADAQAETSGGFFGEEGA